MSLVSLPIRCEVKTLHVGNRCEHFQRNHVGAIIVMNTRTRKERFVSPGSSEGEEQSIMSGSEGC